MLLPSELNNTNDICPFPLRWSQAVIDSQRPILYVCIIGSIIHFIFWLQFIFYPSIRQKTLQWIYAYMITDILLLFQFFFTFIVRTTSNECTSSRSWSLFVCYFEALTNNYLNILEAYILLALNLCRYLQIAYNRNVYATHVHLLTLTHVAIYLFPVISLIIQLSVGWTSVEYRNDSCNVAYTGISIQIINVIFAFGLPISFNILVIYASIRHVHLNSRLRRAQHHVSASEKYHRSLTIQFFIFYTVWLSLWSPYIIVFQLGIGNNNILAITQLLNSIETDLDPMIIGALDVRF